MASLRRHGVTVHRQVSQVPRVYVDKHKMLQILINLLSNARQALDGLHASALAAQMLKGQLTLESKGPGQGAVATLELPLTPTGTS